MEKQALFWIFVVIFSVTAIITLLGITGVIKTIKDKYLNALFYALIIEVVAAMVLLFQNYDFANTKPPINSTPNLQHIVNSANLAVSTNNIDSLQGFIIEKLKTAQASSLRLRQTLTEKDSLSKMYVSTQEELANCSGDLNKLDKSFYSKITRLRNLIMDFQPGSSINIAYEEEEKEEVYRLLIDIFEVIGYIQTGTPVYKDAEKTIINKEVIKTLYSNYRNTYGRTITDKNYIYIDEYDTIQMLRDFLNRFYPTEEKKRKKTND